MLSAGGQRAVRCRGRIRLVQPEPYRDRRHHQRVAERRRIAGQDEQQGQASEPTDGASFEHFLRTPNSKRQITQFSPAAAAFTRHSDQ